MAITLRKFLYSINQSKPVYNYAEFYRFVLNDSFRDTDAVRKLVESYVETAKFNRHYGRELSYVLPRQYVASFPPLFSKLESLVNSGEANEMGFNSYGVSMTTLEEVCLSNQ